MSGRRVTIFAQQSNGSQSFAVTVRGLRVLVTAGDDRREAGEALAYEIATLGPEELASPKPEPEPAPAPVAKQKSRSFRAGQVVWCNVHGSRGFATVTEVGDGRRRGYIKIAGLRAWCPAHNFDESAPDPTRGDATAR